MDVQIPSPTVFLQKSPVLNSALPVAPKKAAKPRTSNVTSSTAKPSGISATLQNGGVAKPKQSKSRNGCMTCKKKRLKCDETKPGCLQCQRRSVTCEGYKKDYKWRTFEETTFTSKPMTKTKKVTTVPSSNPSREPRAPAESPQSDSDDSKPMVQGDPHGISPGFQSALPSHEYNEMSQPYPPLEHSSSHILPQFETHSIYSTPFAVNPSLYSPPFGNFFDPSMMMSNASASSNNETASSGSSMSAFSSSSPQLLDLLLPGTDLNQRPDPSEIRPPMSPLPYQPEPLEMEYEADIQVPVDEEFDEEIVRQPHSATDVGTGSFSNRWSLRTASPAPSESSASSKSSDMTLYAQPRLQATSAEMLMLRFDQQTCGILSVKDGPTENPWRTLVWPLARDSPALYHAISSMTAFHGSTENHEMRVSGMGHMTKSFKHLTTEISDMRVDAALATSLALAFSEGWDEHTSTGIRHLKGAKALVNNAVVKHRMDAQRGQLTTQDAMRFKFLCNTFVYMDVIARLTSLEEDNDLNFEEILATVNAPFGDLIEVDPLMGCATTLFPLIGRVANLIQKVRKSETNSLAIVSHAMELKQLIQQWPLPDVTMFEIPEDPDSEVQHSIQTADAYRYAILLYLHQAVPEIPSESAQVLSKRILMTIASVPPSSRAIIVQIFPLLAASCEVTTQEDRNWVTERWAAMIARLRIGNVDSCFQVVREVWRRRDAFEDEKANRLLRRYTSRGVPTGNFVPPVLMSGKRKAHTFESSDQDALFGGSGGIGEESLDIDRRSAKRRLTLDVMGLPTSISMSNQPGSGSHQPGFSRRTGDMPLESIEPEYTVRGRLHWIGVMKDWDWEVFPG